MVSFGHMYMQKVTGTIFSNTLIVMSLRNIIITIKIATIQN